MRLPLMRELPKGEGEKSFRFARIYDKWYRFSFFSLLPAHLPHQREAQIWKPLLFIIQLHFTDDANTGGQGRPPLQIQYCKLRDKLKFLIFRFPFRKLSTVHYQLSTCLQLLIHHSDRQIGICLSDFSSITAGDIFRSETTSLLREASLQKFAPP